jgi:anthranilate synthase component 2
LKILLIDNYDSFTYNLVHYLEALGANVTVVFNDEIDFDAIPTYDKLVLSPGPGLPEDAGDLNKVIALHASNMPILGVCLGFQALVIHFGGQLFNQAEVKHGVHTTCHADTTSVLFQHTAPTFEIGLYHSWASAPESMPNHLKVTAQSNENIIMAFEHASLPIFGVQFHPESILTQYGKKILQNFLAL